MTFVMTRNFCETSGGRVSANVLVTMHCRVEAHRWASSIENPAGDEVEDFADLSRQL
jgi:hypothetical protein